MSDEPVQKSADRSASILERLVSHPAEIYRAAVDKWGHNSQFEMVVKECAELIAALKRLQRNRTDLMPLLEEIADVEIMSGQMRCIFDPVPSV